MVSFSTHPVLFANNLQVKITVGDGMVQVTVFMPISSNLTQ